MKEEILKDGDKLIVTKEVQEVYELHYLESKLVGAEMALENAKIEIEKYKERNKLGHKIPVLGTIPAGVPIEAVEDIIDWEEIPPDWLAGDRQYFALRVSGDSMYPEYLENDVVIVRKQPSCDNGDDCVVIINGTDATLKRVYISPEGIEVEALNKMYGKRSFTNKEVSEIPINILGIVVELRRKKK